ncbi:hypothetical protein GoPhGRU1p59 [Gordonia phage GRU1]|uniref:Uncharacterized protein n=1 Tax=Gordonia phage GRU1 TaxID=1109710 RepID=G8EK18_9CAUD|nr:hypothetical protein GoPhGRU1p59 [Gordonia phage GRU1]AET09900.1 hypothetical protein [Gordonia phage GRU1]
MKLHTIEFKSRFRVENHREQIVGARAISLVPEHLSISRSRRFHGLRGIGKFHTHWFLEGPRVLKDGTVSDRSTHYRFGDFERASDLDGLRHEGHSELADLIQAAVELLPDAGEIE